jgi:PAS domain-containing protein
MALGAASARPRRGPGARPRRKPQRDCKDRSGQPGGRILVVKHITHDEAIGPLTPPRILTIPSSDLAFVRQVEHLRAGRAGGAGRADGPASTPAELEARLRRLFPRAVVRPRDIVGEPDAWYVYRDGTWRPDLVGEWWDAPGLPRVVVSRDGWIVEATPTALGLLGIEATELGARHFTDFVAPGTLDDSMSLFSIVDEGHDLSATVLLRPTSGDVLSIDIHAVRQGDMLVGLFRLADEVAVDAAPSPVERPTFKAEPATDAAFRGYIELALGRMPEPTPDGLALRLRRLYPHAFVEVDPASGQWIVRREPARAEADAAAAEAGDAWWTDEALPRVRYDGQALILEANDAARSVLGSALVGHHWQEFVTPGSTEQVSAMLAILAEVGQAESRFRMPRADGSLLEFDSWTEVDGDGFTTVMRPRS